MMTISQVGTFDVENYGDLLYPVVFRRAVERRDASLAVRAYTPLPGEAPQGAGFETSSVRGLFERATHGPVVVGGGDILRSDWRVVAEPYARVRRERLSRLRRSIGATASLQYLPRKCLPAPRGDKFYAERFRRRWMGYPAAGPFLLDPARLPGGTAVCYMSCGVPHDFAPSERDEVARTLDRARFIYLRDEQSAEKLRRAGVRREAHVAPDMIVALSEYFDRAAEAAKGRELLSRFGVAPGSPVLCFQSRPNVRFDEEEIVAELERYRRRARAEVVLLPLGYCHDDHRFLRRLAKRSGGAFKYVGLYSVFDLIPVVAACDLFVGTSLHGNVTAFSYGIPHLCGPLPVDKSEGFLRAAGLPASLKLRSWREMNDKIDLALSLGLDFFAARAREAKAKVFGALDALLDSLLK